MGNFSHAPDRIQTQAVAERQWAVIGNTLEHMAVGEDPMAQVALWFQLNCHHLSANLR